MNINKKLVQILVPVLIVAAIGGIWLYKTQQEQTPPEEADIVLAEGAMPLEITAVDLEEIQSHGLPIMLDFGAEACGPCRAMAPALKQIHAEMQGKAVIHYTDAWEYPEATEGFPVQVVPTQFFMNADGTPYVPDESVLQSIPGFQMYSRKDTGEHVFTAHQGGLTAEQMRTILADMGVEL